MANMIRRQVRLSGLVQGVGFRPFVWKLANELGLIGWVNNDSLGVTIEVQGSGAQVDRFLDSLPDSIPPLASIDAMTVKDVAVVDEMEFQILDSQRIGQLSTPISPDISICDDCRGELNDPADRRYRYPFINCTNCGPRFTIVEDIPYDRLMTTMKSFVMCTECQREYQDPSDRRFHAQPNACSQCGPAIWMVSNTATNEQFNNRSEDADTESAIRSFHAAISRGEIVAIKGIGGFHLACDASNASAIQKLRRRKGRVDKPFAVLVRDLAAAESIANVSQQERDLLRSKERPIVLLSKKSAICELAAPGNSFVGVMLPYSPLHELLVAQSPLILTSGNVSDEPIVRTNQEARERLAGLADCFLLHDREINVVCDDSVVRRVGGQLLPIRRSRGYAPMPVELPVDGPSVLAIGGEIKSTFCVTKDKYAYMSQHVGDMGNLETLEAMKRSVDHFLRLFRVELEAVCADSHPDYLSGQWAAQLAKSLGLPLFKFQHHFAHIASLIAEHRLPMDATVQAAKIIGCCFDGTGYGPDGAIWGGEFMLSDGANFERVGHLSYTPLPSGDVSIRRPYRVALAQLWSSAVDWDQELPCVAASSEHERKLLFQQLEKNLNCVATSSMGRLFDAVASLIGVRHQVNYEAQAALEMEAMAAKVIDAVDPTAYRFEIASGPPMQVCCQQMICRICGDQRSNVGQSIIAARFHHAVANMVDQVCQLVRREHSVNTVGLTGGVFQNALLLKLTCARLQASGFDILTHSIVPPNDAGLALGQAVAAQFALR